MNHSIFDFPLNIKQIQIIIDVNHDIVDVYYPDQNPTEINHPPYPPALFLQGFDVDKSYYSQFATEVASSGFIVMVPNHKPAGRSYLAPELKQIIETFEQIKTDVSNLKFPFSQWIDLQRLILLGHSCGGITGIEAIRHEMHLEPMTGYSYCRPPELAAGVFFGTNALHQQNGSKLIRNSGIPMALIAGSLDGVIPPEITREAYDNIETSPKMYILMNGVNHYGINDAPQPPNGIIESHLSTVNHSLIIKTIADCSALFLRAYLFQDTVAQNNLLKQAKTKDQWIKTILEA